MINERIELLHPEVDEVSVVTGKNRDIESHSDDLSYEIAFFKGGKWVLEPIEPFGQWYAPYSQTSVYKYVPRQLVNDFIQKWRVQ